MFVLKYVTQCSTRIINISTTDILIPKCNNLEVQCQWDKYEKLYHKWNYLRFPKRNKSLNDCSITLRLKYFRKSRPFSIVPLNVGT